MLFIKFLIIETTKTPEYVDFSKYKPSYPDGTGKPHGLDFLFARCVPLRRYFEKLCWRR